MLKLIKSIKIKIILLFIFTIILGLWSAGFFEQYAFNFGIVKTFSQAEAKNLVGKRVYDRCVEKTRQKIKVGWTIDYSGRDFQTVHLQIRWNEQPSMIYGYPKDYFEQCMEVEK